MRKSALMLVVLTTVTVFWGCKNTATPYQPASVPQSGIAALDADGAYRLHEKDLEHLGLEIFWTHKLYTQPKERLVNAYILGDCIMMETADRRLYGVDRRDGKPLWVVDVPNRCEFRGCEDEDYIYVPCRNTLIAIDKRGFVAWRRFLKFAPGASPAADAEHVYVPCLDGVMRAFLKDKGYFAWQFTTKGELEAKPAVSSRLVYAGSNDGFVYALTTEKLDPSWSYRTHGPVRAGILYDGGDRRVYVASTDGNLYCLEGPPQATREQQLAWLRPYATGAGISSKRPPHLTDKMVLVVNDDRQCHAVNREHGRKLWMVPNVEKVLAQGRLNTYLLRGASTIVAADNKTGVVRWQRNLQPGTFAFFLTNSLDDTIYLVKSDGETQALRERRLAPTPTPEPPKAPEAALEPEAEPAPEPAE